jgi:hypothetical protein
MSDALALDEKRKEAYALYEELKTKLVQHGYVFLRVGKILKQIRDEELYKHIGDGGNDSFSQFLASPEIAIKRPTAYLYIRVYEFYIELMQFSEEKVVAIPAYKLFRLLPLLKDKSKEEVGSVLDGVLDLGTQDTEKVIEERHLDPWKRPKLFRCSTCNKWHIEYVVTNICECDGVFKLTQIEAEVKP